MSSQRVYRYQRMLVAVLLAALVLPSALVATEYHVRLSGGINTNPGTQALPWKTITYGLTQLYAGDTLWVHAGTYFASTYEFSRSGTAGSPITVAAWPGDYVRLNTVLNGFYITKDHIVIDGLDIYTNWSNRGVRADGNYITVRNCTFPNGAIAYKSSLSTRNHHQLIENCTIWWFTEAPVLFDAMDSIIIRNNTIWNSVNMNLIDTGGVSNMLIEGNFAYNTGNPQGELMMRWGNSEPQSGDNFNGAIVRRNVFVDGRKWLILIMSANGGMFYNNTLCKLEAVQNERGLIYMRQHGSAAAENKNENNVIKNNVFYSTGSSGNFFIDISSDMSEDYGDQQIDWNLYYKPSGTQYIRYGGTIVYDSGVNGWYGGQYDVNSLVGMNPMLASPLTSSGAAGFELTVGSPAIDAGGPLTKTVGSGSGTTTVNVEDARYFCDGMDMIPGDMVRIGANPAVRVVSRDIINNTIQVDSSVIYNNGDPVSLNYVGHGMDIGAFEYGGTTASIAGRHVFYNDSAFDGNDLAANAADDGAIATDKIPLMSGGTASFANYTSYSRGINGVMVDIADATGTPSASDFEFEVGNDSNLNNFVAGPAPSSVTVRPGEGVGGSDRVTILFPDDAIKGEWLKVTVKSTGNTGLLADDVFFLGNAPGDTGNSASDAEVTPSDEVIVRNNSATLAINPAAITEVCDFNRDRKVGPTDQIISRNNGTSGPTALQLIIVP